MLDVPLYFLHSPYAMKPTIVTLFRALLKSVFKRFSAISNAFYFVIPYVNYIAQLLKQ